MLTEKELSRYNRHLIIPEIGIEGQENLKKAKVLIIGCGGLGNAMLPYLAAAGIGHIGMVDFDTVDDSNLQRQIMFRDIDIGEPKASIMEERLKAINPYIKTEVFLTRLTLENAFEIMSDFDIIADGTDNFETRYLVNDACVLLGKPNVFASIYRFDAQISVFSHKNGPCYRCLFPEPPPQGSVPSCAEAGVLGVLPGIAGAFQANEIIKIAARIGKPIVGRLFLLNTLTFETNIFQVEKDPECRICGRTPTITKLEAVNFQCTLLEGQEKTPEISVTELQTLKQNNVDHILIDVREPNEYEICNLRGKLIPLGSIENRWKEIDPVKKIIIHCKSGKRSEKGCALLKEKLPDAEILNLEGGILKWIEEIDGSLKKY